LICIYYKYSPQKNKTHTNTYTAKKDGKQCVWEIHLIFVTYRSKHSKEKKCTSDEKVNPKKKRKKQGISQAGGLYVCKVCLYVYG
jgi:hypothetical protein